MLLAIGFYLFKIFYHPKVNYEAYSNQPITHEKFTAVLQKTVDDGGWVDYKMLQENPEPLQEYLDLLKENHPSEGWTEDEKLAYWINAYNAFTLELIIRNYPLESIRDIRRWSLPFLNSAWDIKFIEIENEKYSLNNIEHDIIRAGFDEPRIHFAVNCASYSCPPLLNIAYEAHTLDDQLEQQAINFVNDSLRNRVSTDKAELSKIFYWYKGDFTKDGTLIEYLNQFSKSKMDSEAEIEFIPYDWSLNEQ